MFPRRSALLLLALIAVAPPVVAQPKPDWTKTVAATPEGGVRIGNPAAKVKLIEFASYTCSHCKSFNEEGVPGLQKHIATGKLSFEQRSFVRNGPDFAASLLVACLPARQSIGLAEGLFKDFANWTAPLSKISQADNEALGKLPPEQQPARLAEVIGLDGWAAKRGLPLAKGRACLADKALQERLLGIRTEAMDKYKLTGTPLFVINGVTVADTFDWAALEPKLIAALK